MLMTDPKPNEAFEWTQEPWGRALRCAALAVPHLFTSRDLTLRGEEGEWAAVSASLDVPPERLLLVKQVHGVRVAVARRGTRAWPKPEADIVITDDPSGAIGVRVADCAPILLFDARTNTAGAVHAGWRGTAASAVSAAVRAMREEFGVDPGSLTAAIGPCLGRCCGEVGPDVVDAFTAGGADAASLRAWFAPGEGDRAFLDLERANRDQLEGAGLRRDRIFGAALCTKTHHDRLHSYRARRNEAGRMLAAIRCRVSE
jgi:YfiH family protein